MTTTTQRAIAERILAIDLGKYKSDASLYHSCTGEAQWCSFDTTREELTQRLTKLRPDVVVFEACALSGWVYDLCMESRQPCRVANTAAEAWKFKHTKRK